MVTVHIIGVMYGYCSCSSYICIHYTWDNTSAWHDDDISEFTRSCYI